MNINQDDFKAGPGAGECARLFRDLDGGAYMLRTGLRPKFDDAAVSFVWSGHRGMPLLSSGAETFKIECDESRPDGRRIVALVPLRELSDYVFTVIDY
jgi:hypothetical protein